MKTLPSRLVAALLAVVAACAAPALVTAQSQEEMAGGMELAAEADSAAAADTVAADTIAVDSAAAADTAAADTVAADSLAVVLASDTVAGDTVAVDSIAADSSDAGTLSVDSLAALLAADTIPEDAPTMAPPGRWGSFDFPAPRFQGRAAMTTDLYHAGGIDNRRPGLAWRMMLDPSMTLPGNITMGVDLMVSTEETRVDQSISRLGISPRWSWGTLHLGDFSRDHSRYTVEGLRVRGAGLDVHGRGMRASVQSGRAQRTVPGVDGGPVFRRNMVAFSAGIGDSQRSHLDLQLLSVRDDPTREELELVTGDTLLLDTIPPDLRPEAQLRPQENFVVGMEGQLSLVDRMLTLRGEMAASLYTRDLFSDRLEHGRENMNMPGGILDALEGRHPVRVSSSVDYAWQTEARFRRGGHGLRAGFEEVGPGYTSLGLPYLMNDRRAWNVGGNTRLLGGRIGLQGQHRAQVNNLLGQRRNTVNRGTTSLGTAWRITDRLSTTINAVVAGTRNDATQDSLRLDNQALSVSTSGTHQGELFGRSAMTSVSYGFQRTRDGNPFSAVPEVITHSIAPSVQVTLTPDLNVAPQLSYNLTSGEGMETQRNFLMGARGSARFRDGTLRTTGNLTQTISQGRQIMAAQLRGSFPLSWDAEGSVQLRFSRYGAFGDRPGFRESFVTFSVARTF